MEAALEGGNLVEALAFLQNLSPDQLQNDLKDHSIKGLPTFHYLARFRIRSEDEDVLNKLIKIFVQSGGYDINKRTDIYLARKRASLGFTALFAAVEQSNLVLVKCLLRNEAKTNIRDSSGFFPIHWAIFVGDLKCFEKLIEVGGGSIVLSTKEKDVHPILHTAVDEGRIEMVFYMLNSSGGTVTDINEKAIYPGVMSESAFVQFPSRYDSNPEVLETVDTSFTPLARAVRMRKIPIIEMLLKHGAKLSGFSELHFCIMEGDTEVACLLKQYFSDADLCNDKISGNWALHCLHPVAFQDEFRVEKTRDLIYEYIDAGWDVNCTSPIASFKKISFDVPANHVSFLYVREITDFSLLHIACFERGHPMIIQGLIEEGAEVNKKTGKNGGACLYPLQILLLLKQWDNAVYLINEGGADFNLVGSTGSAVTCLSRKQTIEVINYKKDLSGQVMHSNCDCFNSVELLLALHDSDGLTALDSMLKKGFVCHGANELHIAIEGGNPFFVSKILQHSSCDLLTVEELTWLSPDSFQGYTSCGQNVAALVWLMSKSLESPCEALAEVITCFVSKGYDCNLTVRKRDGISIQSFEIPADGWNPLIFDVLNIDFLNGSTLLLRTLLQFGHLKLNVMSLQKTNPLEHVMKLWDAQCRSQNKKCWKIKEDQMETYCCEVVKLLVSHGIDVTSIKIGSDFKYHVGYKAMLQMLFCAGAKITDDFFLAPVCHAGYLGTKSFSEEIKQLREWMKKFDKCNLEYWCRLEVRKLIGTVGDLKLLEALPKSVKADVLVAK